MSQPILPPVIEAPTKYGPRDFDGNYILWWNKVALDLNRVTHSLGGPQNGPPLSARALAILHLAIHDAYFSVMPAPPLQLYLAANPANPPPVVLVAGETNMQAINDSRLAARDAVAGAATTVLNKLYRKPDKLDNNPSQKTLIAIGSFIDKALTDFVQMTATRPLLQADRMGIPSDPAEPLSSLNMISPSFAFGAGIAKGILAALEVKAGEPGTDKGIYVPKDKDYFFGDEPTHPVFLVKVDPNDQSATPALRENRPYHGPLYGSTAKRFAVQHDYYIADPPIIPRLGKAASSDADIAEYNDAVEDVHRMGGAPNDRNTLRQDYQTAGGLFWAYDGANLIGTPPRLYNQILRQIAYDRRQGCDKNIIDSEVNNAEFARLFALANVALADAGIFAWREKYTYELWRPLSGVRQDPSGPAPYGIARPTWLTFGAPQTNSHQTPFKPPFPSYPSGHATFGAAIFQTIRQFYKARDHLKWELDEADDICFDMISDEMNGINRDLDKDYDPKAPITGQPGVVRTKHIRHFTSLWEAMFDNALSRVWLGVHWRFDAFAAEDVLLKIDAPHKMAAQQSSGSIAIKHPKEHAPLYQQNADGSTTYKDAKEVKYNTTGKRKEPKPKPQPNCDEAVLAGVGGVPLGIAIANDIFANGDANKQLRPANVNIQPPSVW